MGQAKFVERLFHVEAQAWSISQHSSSSINFCNAPGGKSMLQEWFLGYNQLRPAIRPFLQALLVKRCTSSFKCATSSRIPFCQASAIIFNQQTDK
jgi:hypothetical protein